MDNELQRLSNQTPAIERQVQSITMFLDSVGLPSEGIIAPLDQREIMGKNLPSLLESLPDEVKKDARYLSKFVVGAGFGLFDYSLNSIWNEVVLALHKIVIAYGLDIFFDKAVGAPIRGQYKDEEDLAMIKDKVLLDTCKKLELISETSYKKLAHILDMRNDIGISHPTDVTINAYELLGWVQTCIHEVLMGQPSQDAIQVKAFIGNLKEYDQVVDANWVDQATPKLQSLPTRHCDSIIRTFFALYVSLETDASLQKNISILAPIVWPLTTEDEKNRLGITLGGYKNNLHKTKFDKGSEFFGFVRGNNYLSITDRTINLDSLTNRLKNAHYSYDNYYHEGPIMEEIMTYITTAEDIPKEVVHNLVTTVVLCRIGRGFSYHGGVSPKAMPYYDMLLKIIGPKYTPIVLSELAQSEAQRKIDRSSYSRTAVLELLECIHSTVIDGRQKEAIEYLTKNMGQNPAAIYSREFKLISAPFLKWS
jgi:hypothetical protein